MLDKNDSIALIWFDWPQNLQEILQLSLWSKVAEVSCFLQSSICDASRSDGILQDCCWSVEYTHNVVQVDLLHHQGPICQHSPYHRTDQHISLHSSIKYKLIWIIFNNTSHYTYTSLQGDPQKIWLHFEWVLSLNPLSFLAS